MIETAIRASTPVLVVAGPADGQAQTSQLGRA